MNATVSNTTRIAVSSLVAACLTMQIPAPQAWAEIYEFTVIADTFGEYGDFSYATMASETGMVSFSADFDSTVGKQGYEIVAMGDGSAPLRVIATADDGSNGVDNRGISAYGTVVTYETDTGKDFDDSGVNDGELWASISQATDGGLTRSQLLVVREEPCEANICVGFKDHWEGIEPFLYKAPVNEHGVLLYAVVPEVFGGLPEEREHGVFLHAENVLNGLENTVIYAGDLYGWVDRYFDSLGHRTDIPHITHYALNEKDQVVFFGAVREDDESNTYGIYRSAAFENPNTWIQIAGTGTKFEDIDDSNFDINDQGTVAFMARENGDDHFGVYLGSGGDTTPGMKMVSGSGVSINNAGELAVLGTPNKYDHEGVYFADGSGRVQPVMTLEDSFNGMNVTGFEMVSGNLNTGGQVAFIVKLDGGAEGGGHELVVRADPLGSQYSKPVYATSQQGSKYKYVLRGCPGPDCTLDEILEQLKKNGRGHVLPEFLATPVHNPLVDHFDFELDGDLFTSLVIPAEVNSCRPSFGVILDGAKTPIRLVPGQTLDITAYVPEGVSHFIILDDTPFSPDAVYPPMTELITGITVRNAEGQVTAYVTVIVPEPGALSLLLAAGVVLARTKRRV